MSSNIFGGDSERQKEEYKDTVDTHSKALLAVVQRQKDLESSLSLMEEKLELFDHNSVKNFKKMFNEIKDLRSELRDIKQDIGVIIEFNGKMKKQISLMSTKDEVQKLEKYIDLWNPMDFVTKEELFNSKKEIISEIEKIVKGFISGGKSNTTKNNNKSLKP